MGEISVLQKFWSAEISPKSIPKAPKQAKTMVQITFGVDLGEISVLQKFWSTEISPKSTPKASKQAKTMVQITFGIDLGEISVLQNFWSTEISPKSTPKVIWKSHSKSSKTLKNQWFLSVLELLE